MAYCANCGHVLTDAAVFCANCGAKIQTTENKDTATYSGELHKCPNCGELLSAFAAECPTCGYELRGAKLSGSFESFAASIEKAKDNLQVISLIRSYPIPNTREDIFEFLILASTNIGGCTSKQVFDAWVAKFEQCYQKAMMVITNPEDGNRVQSIYDKTTSKIRKERIMHWMGSVGSLFRKYFEIMPSPAFGVVTILLIIWTISLILTGTLYGIYIIFDVIILWITYLITVKRKD